MSTHTFFSLYIPSPVATVKVPLSQPCFDHFFGPCFRGHDEAGLLAFSMSLFSDVGPLETIAENKTEQKSAAKRRQRLLKAALTAAKLRCAFSHSAERIVDELGLLYPENRGNLRKNMASV